MTHEEFLKRYTYNPTTDSLGEGGFGKVFKAYDTHRDRWVAIKIAEAKPGLEQVRLKKEVDMVNNLPTHPNIAYYEECYTFSSFAGEYDFGILQFYEAGNLQQLAQRTQLTPMQKEAILIQLLEGIGFLHEHGIIHRDLKPANILMVNRNGEYIPKITDFGISKQLDINKSSVFNNSLAGAGTLSYASPEQLGDRTIRKNTDLWSFGVIAYWLLTGKLPFNTGSHGTTSEAGRAELFRQINQGQLPAEANTLPGQWPQVVEACLVVDPELRVKKSTTCLEILQGKKPADQEAPPTTFDPPAPPPTSVEPARTTPTPAPLPQAHKGKTNKILYGLLGLAAVVIIVLLIARLTGGGNAEKLVADSTAYHDSMASVQALQQLITDSLAAAEAAGEAQATREAEEEKAWRTAKTTNSKASYEKYLLDYKKGRYVTKARSAILKLQKAESESKSGNSKENGEDGNETASEETFSIVESMPEYMGGDEARMKFLRENIVYPLTARESGIQGTVYVSFIVEKDGQLTNLRIVRDIGGGCGDEAIRVIKAMPKWKPGSQRGKPVRVQFNMPVKFTLTK